MAVQERSGDEMEPDLIGEAVLALGVTEDELAEARRLTVEMTGEPASVAGRRYDQRLEEILGLVADGYPTEIGALVPLYWPSRRRRGWCVLGGAYGKQAAQDAYVYSSKDEVESEIGLCRMLDLAAVKALHPAQFTEGVRSELRALGDQLQRSQHIAGA